MARFKFIFLLLPLVLAACGGGSLHLNLSLPNGAGLKEGDPIVIGDRPVGEVTAVEAVGDGRFLVRLSIEEEFRDEATQSAQFAVIADPEDGARRQVELRPGNADAAVLEDGATVTGSIETGGLFGPLGEMLRGLTQGLGALQGEVERFRSELQRLPQSEEGKRLKDQWAKLLEELKSAQQSTDEALKKEVVPKLQKDLDDLQRQFKDALVPPPEPRKERGI